MTPDIIRKYIVDNNLTTWHFYVNDQNLGWKKNFYKLIDECDTDLVFLADQDDVWNKRKLELMIPVFSSQDVNILASDYKQKSRGLSLNYKAKKSKKVKKIVFNEKLIDIKFPGCTYCIRKKYFDSIKEWYREWLPHDSFLYRNAMLDGSLFYIHSDLIIHRMSGINEGSKRTFSQPKNDLNHYKEVVKLLKQRYEIDMRARNINIQILNKCEFWFLEKEKFYKSKSIISFLRLFRYINYYPHLKTYIKEILVANT